MTKIHGGLTGIFLVLAVVPCLLCAVPATAARVNLTPSLSVTKEFNDNIFLDAEDEEQDWLTKAAAGLQLERQSVRFQLQGTARLEGLKYLDNDELDALDQHYLASGNYRLTPRLAVNGEAQYKRDSQADRDLAETGLALGTERRDSQSYGCGAEYALTERSRLSLGYAFSRIDYQEEDEAADSDSHYAILGWQYELTERLQGLANFNYSHSDFSGSRLDNAVLQAGFGFASTERWSLQATAGARYTRSRYEELVPVLVVFPFVVYEKQDASSSDWGWVARLSASWQGERNKARLSLQREVRLASGRTGSTELSALVLSGSHRLTEKLSLTLAGGFYLNQAGTNEFAGEGIDELTLRLSPGLRYRWNEDLSVILGYNYTGLQDRETDEDSTRNLAFIRLDYRYPVEL